MAKTDRDFYIHGPLPSIGQNVRLNSSGSVSLADDKDIKLGAVKILKEVGGKPVATVSVLW